MNIMSHYLTYFLYINRNTFHSVHLIIFTIIQIHGSLSSIKWFYFEHFEVDDMLRFYDSMPMIFIHKARSKHISLNTFLCNYQHHNLSLHYLSYFQKEHPYHLDAVRTNAKWNSSIRRLDPPQYPPCNVAGYQSPTKLVPSFQIYTIE